MSKSTRDKDECRLCVLIAVYNNAEGLAKSLASLMEESAAFDIVIVDDGSVPPVGLDDQHQDRKVELIRLPRSGGLSAALNTGLEWALSRDYQYIGRLDAGDTVQCERFTKQLSLLEADPKCVLVSSDVLFVTESDESLWLHKTPNDDEGIRRELWYSNILMHPSVTMRLSAVQKVGRYPNDRRVSEDYYLFRCLARVGRLASVPEALTACCFSQNGISVKHRRSQQVERLAIQLRFFDFTSVHSYLGIVRGLMSVAVPARFNKWRKSRRFKTAALEA